MKYLDFLGALARQLSFGKWRRLDARPIPSATCPSESVLPIRLRPEFSVVFEGYAGGAEHWHERHYLWRPVDHEGEVLESFVTKTRDKKAALKFLKKALKRHGCSDEIVIDRLRSYGAALREIGIGDRQETGRWANNRAENSHQPFRRRERAMLRFRRMRTLQKFASVRASVLNHFNQERSLSTRTSYKGALAAALAEWRGLCAE